MDIQEISEEIKVRNSSLDSITPNFDNSEFTDIKLEETTNENKKIINPQYDYSNIVPDKEHIKILVQYCFAVYNQLLKLFEENEKKNERLKPEYKNYEYKKHYETGIEIISKERAKAGEFIGSTFTFKDFKTFIDYIDRKPKLDSLKISLNLSFKRGQEYENTEHLNSFKISFEPYNITFTRKSNCEDESMDQIEHYIKSVLDRFNIQDTIFYSK